MYIAPSEKPIDSAVSESVMVMSMSEQTVDKYTLEGGSDEEKRKEES